MVSGGSDATRWCQVVQGSAMPGDPRCLKMNQNGPKMIPDGVRWYKVGSGGSGVAKW